MNLVKAMRALILMLVVVLTTTACDFSVYKMPLPGGADTGDNPMVVKARFDNVLDLVPQSTVKLADVTIGKVTDVSLDGYTAVVTMELDRDVKLPDNTSASLRQTSLLGEKFVSLTAPETGGDGLLSDGDIITDTGRSPEVEDVLGAMSLVLNGGGVAQLKTIANELNTALEGREGSAKSLLRQLRLFMRQLDNNKTDIVTALKALNRLSKSVNGQRKTIDLALDKLPSALRSLNSQRKDLIKMLKSLDTLSATGVRVILASKQATINSLNNLGPILTKLADAGDAFPKSLQVFLTYPFVDEAVGRDPAVARNLHMGDYTNLSIKLDVALDGGDSTLPTLPPLPTVPPEVCVPLSDIPDDTPVGELPENLCQGAIDAINDCLKNPSVETCEGIPGAIVDAVCDSTIVSTLCPGQDPSSTPTGLPLPTLPSLPRPAPGSGSATDHPKGPTMGQLMETYDPAFVSLLVPGVVR